MGKQKLTTTFAFGSLFLLDTCSCRSTWIHKKSQHNNIRALLEIRIVQKETWRAVSFEGFLWLLAIGHRASFCWTPRESKRNVRTKEISQNRLDRIPKKGFGMLSSWGDKCLQRSERLKKNSTFFLDIGTRPCHHPKGNLCQGRQ